MTERQDDSLGTPNPIVHNEVSGLVGGHLVQAHTIFGGIHLNGDSQSELRPQQLPPALRIFVGRKQELARLDAALDESRISAAIFIIDGTGGIGKTSLAIYWAQQHIDRFPDGQLYVNMRGFDPSNPPMQPDAALRGFLSGLGVEPTLIPSDIDTQTALYRSLVANKRMLVVIDNALDLSQVDPLLPGSASCLAIVTSRNRLTGLAMRGAYPINLDFLNQAEARELMQEHLEASRMAAESDAVNEILDYCAGLPMAISIMAARAAVSAKLPLFALAEELRNESGRLDGLDGGDLSTSLRTVFSCSYQDLSEDVAFTFRLLGLAPGPEISLAAVAELNAESVTRTRILLRTLETAHLLQQPSPERYRLHDLIRLHISELASQKEPLESQEAALRRLVCYYLSKSSAGAALIDPARQAVDISVSAEETDGRVFRSLAEALIWFDVEYPCLIAAQKLAESRDWNLEAIQFTQALAPFQYRRDLVNDRHSVREVALRAAQKLNDQAILIKAHRNFGQSCSEMGAHQEALEHLDSALALAEQYGDIRDIAFTHNVLALTWSAQDDHKQALAHVTEALQLFRKLGEIVWEGDALNSIGWHHAHLGNFKLARQFCEQSLAIDRQLRDELGEAVTLKTLGYIARRNQCHNEALDHYGRILTLSRQLDSAVMEAEALDCIGQCHADLGRAVEACKILSQARDLYRKIGRDSEANRTQDSINSINGPLGD
ncbi:tetratricopeptide repeat protein [Crossiella sp. SN42]|uniref:ATP-binding protein n=1 Tax=Crossiella sp. SN42 TaxID=2944808 RepID=UPI00207C532B|nr:tetratricopeptide repeat protein [Crossiella sp. SN42]MCO1575371.1 tetratricopeptide repeat protein [Crossiella sp. SN42]